MTKERPIIFSGEMVRAILDGRKTQTRRIVKPQPTIENLHRIDVVPKTLGLYYDWSKEGNVMSLACPYGKPGDKLWVRETFFYEWPDEDPPDDMRDCRIVYRASEPDYITSDMRESVSSYRWSSSIHMPRWASRITLEITGVRVERLVDITDSDCYAEGITSLQNDILGEPYYSYKDLWDKLNAKRGYPWDSNPWVWVIEFKRITP